MHGQLNTVSQGILSFKRRQKSPGSVHLSQQMNKQVFYVCVILHIGDLVLVFNIKQVESE